MKKNSVLDQLVASGVLSSYEYENVSEDGIVGDESKCRNTEQIVLNFPNNQTLTVGTFCSGCLENTSLDFKLEGPADLEKKRYETAQLMAAGFAERDKRMLESAEGFRVGGFFGPEPTDTDGRFS